jgi:hypothetical protein
MTIWTQGLATTAGLALMAAPGVLPYADAAATNARIVGPFVATFGCVAMREVTRPLRWVNVPLGAWLVAAPLVLNHGAPAAATSVACGAVVAALSLVRGAVRHHFGGNWSVLRRRDPYRVGRDAVDGPGVPGRP